MQEFMFSKKEVSQLKSQLSIYHSDYIKKIIDETNLSRPTISKFFNHKEIKPDTQLMIYESSVKMIKEKKEELKKLSQSLKEIIHGESPKVQ